MTINSAANKTIALGNGSQTQFAFGFVGVAAAYISVIFTDASGNETVLSQGMGATQYQIALNPAVQGALWGIGGTVTYNPSGSPIATNTSLTIFRTLPLTQAISLQNQISLSELGNGAETGLDTLEMQLQQVSENIARAITAPIVDPATINLVLPPAAQRANTGIAFDGSGNVIAGTTPATGLISSAMQPVVDAASLAIGRAAFGLGSVATKNIGAGLADDGAGNLRVNNPITQVATNQTVTSAFDLERFIATGPINFTLPRANTLWNGFGFWVDAVVGDVTLLIDSHDEFAGNLTSGSSFAVPAGASVFVTTDAASSGIWYVEGLSWLVPNARSVSGAHNVSNADNAKILNHDSGAFGTIQFPAANTLRSDFRCMIVNGETTPIGKGVSGVGNTFLMYPGQSYVIFNNGGTLEVQGGNAPTTGGVPSRLSVMNCDLFIDGGVGSDNPLIADGLSTGARAYKTIGRALQACQQNFDHNGSFPMMTIASGLYEESLTVAADVVATRVVYINGAAPVTFGGAGGSYSAGVQWCPAGAGTPFCLIVGDGGRLSWSNIFFDASPINITSTAIQMHQDGVVDYAGGGGFGSFGNTGGIHVGSDGAGWSFNINASYHVTGAGGAFTHINGVSPGIVTHAGSVTVTLGTGASQPNISNWFNALGGTIISLGASISWVNAPLTGCRKWSSGPAGFISLSGNAANVPGSVAGSPTTGSAPSGGSGWAVA